MELQLKNIGMIKEANVKIDGLTVIAGENDTGKSTVGKSVFCITKAIAMAKSGYFYKNREKFINIKLNDLKSLVKYFGKNKQSYDRLANKVNIIEKNIKKLNLEKENNRYLTLIEELEEFFFNELKENKNIIKPIFKELKSVISDNFKDKFKKDVMNNILNYMFDKDYLKHASKKAQILLDDNIVGKKNQVFINQKGVDKVIENGKIFFDVTFIDTPVILQIYSILKDPEVYAKEYSPTMKDIVRKLLSEPKESIWNRDFANKLIEKIANIVKCDIKIEEGEILAYKQNDKLPIKLANLATGIKSFGLLLLLIEKGYVAKNTLLVLDEPEVHLHPKWQLEMAKVIVELVKNGVKVLVNSHSPYMIDALKYYSDKEEVNSNFYIAQKNSEETSMINDVTMDISPIFEVLTEPLRELRKMKLGLK